MRDLIHIWAVGAILLLSSVAGAASENGAEGGLAAVVFQIQQLENETGQVQCGLFVKDSWLKKPIMGVVTRIDNHEATCTFKRVPPGRYAIAAHHDEDGDGDIDSFLGVPTEPYCFSSGASAGLGPPSFRSASFRHGGSITVQRASMD